MRSKSCKMSIEERYKLLIQARNFHYENFSKWMTYFYVAIGALFVGYCSISYGDSKKDTSDIQFMILVAGYVISLFWYLSSKGYYHWNINFITLVNYYEEELLKFKKSERVYFVHANTKNQNNYWSPIIGANISTSKIAILFSFVVSIFWGILLCNTLLGDVLARVIVCRLFIWPSMLIISVIGTLTLGAIFGKYLKSYIKHFPDLELEFKELR